ncbi:MAG: type II toxin-antitoxin system HicB family antitoxin [Deltaproteobacteria bacterium]|nr:type II toxin-antitoxin system HicB family antitoxin [Deltaproteobacteria bacterium]
MLTYPVILTLDDNGTIMVEFPDVPEALTCGRDDAEALAMAEDALLVALAGAYMDEHRPLPQPSSPAPDQPTVTVPPLATAKLAIYQAMLDQGVSQTELAARLDCDPRQVRRLLDLNHRSRLDQMEKALQALGRQLVIEVHQAA